jgi:uncharacterized membrane protein YcaP (DUF421 family)
MSNAFFDSWTPIVRVFAVGIPAYLLLILLLRITGKRTLSKLNAFDLVITIAFGSVLASVLVSESVTLATGVAAFAFLVLAQYLLTWLTVRSAKVRQILKSQPTLLYYEGEYIAEALRRERVIEAELQATARAQGHASLKSVRAIILETDGSLTAIGSSDGENPLAGFDPAIRSADEGR